MTIKSSTTVGGSRAIGDCLPTSRYGVGTSSAAAGHAEIKKVFDFTDGSAVGTYPTPVPVTSGSMSFLLSEIDQGAAFNERIGLGVYLKRFTVRGRLEGPANYRHPTMRFILLRSKGASSYANAPNAGKVLEYPGAYESIVLSPLSLGGMNEYTVLDDWRVSVGDALSAEGVVMFDRSIDVDAKCTYVGEGGDATYVGGLWIMIMSDQADVSFAPLTTLSFEVTFLDA